MHAIGREKGEQQVESKTIEDPLRLLRQSPLHNKHSWVFRGTDANEPGRPHQKINPPHRLSSLLVLRGLVRQPPNAPLEDLKDSLPAAWGPAEGPLSRGNGSSEINVNYLEDVVDGDEKVRRGR